MIKRIITFSIISLCLSLCTLYAQTSSHERQPIILKSLNHYESGKGVVQIIQDHRIDELITKYTNDNPNKRSITGYRIRIFSDSKQGADKRMRDAKAKFIGSFPDIDIASTPYEAPDWKIYVGNFRTRSEAFMVKKQIEAVFPNAFIVEQKIEYTKL